ncbi:MAG: HAD-IA family hydrolase [Luminiphilus sp.]|nr:HAD-IA family hydrolase [Luminiphilus sp.]MBL6901027.1 HAD-IA family hydrolase [Luminiphilus sp.]
MKLESGPDRIVTAVDWTEVNHVLLDMDGTLLDLAFDNDFWGLRIHEKYAELNNTTVDETRARFGSVFHSVEGTLNWYSTDFWSNQYGFDVIEHSRAFAGGIKWLPFAKAFLSGLRQNGIRTTIVTNAHPDIVSLKHAALGIRDFVDETISSHTLGHAKESPIFWLQLQQCCRFDSETTLFFDDSAPVINAALAFGLQGAITVCCPDSGRDRRAAASQYAIDDFQQLTTGLTQRSST